VFLTATRRCKSHNPVEGDSSNTVDTSSYIKLLSSTWYVYHICTMTVETSIQYTVYLSAQNLNANLQFSMAVINPLPLIVVHVEILNLLWFHHTFSTQSVSSQWFSNTICLQHWPNMGGIIVVKLVREDKPNYMFWLTFVFLKDWLRCGIHINQKDTNCHA